MTVEVTQEHIQIVKNTAIHIYRTNAWARKVGQDELESQGLVILWEAVQAYDDSRGVTFEPFLTTRVKQRLIDWLRHEYGRVNGKTGKMSARTRFALASTSLEGIAEWTDGDHHRVFWDHHSVEDQVMDRLDLEATFRAIKELTPRRRQVMGSLLAGDTHEELQALTGANKNTLASNRSQARNDLCRATGIERTKRAYARKVVE